MLDMLHSTIYVICVYTYHCEGVLKTFLAFLLFFGDLCSQKATKGSELQFLCTQGTIQGGE